MIVQDEPKARALYEKMVDTIKQAESLSYRSMCWGTDGRFSMYQVQLKRPGLFRIILTNGMSDKETIVTNDGERFRVHWSGTRPYLETDDFDSYEETRSDVYIEWDVSDGPILVRGTLAELGVGWYEMILEGGLLFGLADPLEPYIDGICCRGTNEMGGELCDVIEISYMQAQRSRHVWLSRQDHLPRRIKDIVRLTEPHVTAEEWFNVAVDSKISDSQFAWTPPTGWRSFTPRLPDEFLLAPGQDAPDFEMLSLDGEAIRLSRCRGKIVWLYFWKLGDPRCREQLARLQAFYDEHRDRGLAIVAVNVFDDKRIVEAFLESTNVTFPVILDLSGPARKLAFGDYQNKIEDVPLSYLIGKDGQILDAWYGPGGRSRAERGIETTSESPIRRVASRVIPC